MCRRNGRLSHCPTPIIPEGEPYAVAMAHCRVGQPEGTTRPVGIRRGKNSIGQRLGTAGGSLGCLPNATTAQLSGDAFTVPWPSLGLAPKKVEVVEVFHRKRSLRSIALRARILRL